MFHIWSKKILLRGLLSGLFRKYKNEIFEKKRIERKDENGDIWNKKIKRKEQKTVISWKIQVLLSIDTCFRCKFQWKLCFALKKHIWKMQRNINDLWKVAQRYFLITVYSVLNPLCPFLSYSFFKPMLQNIKCKKKFNN